MAQFLNPRRVPGNDSQTRPLRTALHSLVSLAAVFAVGCGTSQSQTGGVWKQPDEHLIVAAPCGDRCRSHQACEVVWRVDYPQNLKLTNFRLACRNIGPGYPCAIDSEIDVDDDARNHKATIYWSNKASTVRFA
jgi:hypothetical protein